MPLDHQMPIACAGVTVMPGDVVVGDGEGAVVVPAALAEEVAADAYQQELEEEWALGRVAAGESTIGVFPIASDRRPEFEAWLADEATMSAGPGRVVQSEDPVRHGGGSSRFAGRNERSCMTRRSIEIEGFHHANPIPARRRVGPLLASSVIAARDPGSDRMPDDAEAQIANLFHHVGEMLRTAGADWRHVVKMNFYVPDIKMRVGDQRALARALPRRRRPPRPPHPGRPRALRRRLVRLPRLRGGLSDGHQPAQATLARRRHRPRRLDLAARPAPRRGRRARPATTTCASTCSTGMSDYAHVTTAPARHGRARRRCRSCACRGTSRASSGGSSTPARSA